MSNLYEPADLLCHYTTASAAFEHILPSGQLLMNPYSRMRDPLENRDPHFSGAAGWGDNADAQFREFFALQAAVRRSRDGHHLLSLTQGDLDAAREPLARMFACPWARARMWEQYSENHAGVCLVFDRDALTATLQEQFGTEGGCWEGPVTYTPEGFSNSSAGQVLFGQFDLANLDADVRRYVAEHHQDFFFLKTTDWATEFEYRFVARPSQATDDEACSVRFVSYGSALRWVVVGERFPVWQRLGARRVADAAGAEFRRMMWDLNRPFPAPNSQEYAAEDS